MGVALHGSGFILEPGDAVRIRGSGANLIRGFVAGRDLLQTRRERFLIDFSGMSESVARAENPAVFQDVFDYVRPERAHNKRDALKEVWWRFGWERPVLRRALMGLCRYIATTETSKHRVFQLLDQGILADHSIVCIASDDAAVLGSLSSAVHVAWSLAAGGRLGVGNDPRYNKTRCLDPFPFPTPAETRDPVKQVRAVADALAGSPAPLTTEELASRFAGRGPWRKRLPHLLDILVALGRAHRLDDRYSTGR